MALGLNIVVGFAGLLDLGYVAFFAIGAYTMGWFGSSFFASADIHVGVSEFLNAQTGHPPQLAADPADRGALRRVRRRGARLPDAAPARRLHRDRDARLRRDHRPHRDQLRRGRLRDRRLQPDQRPPGINPVDKIDLPFVEPFRSLDLRPWYWTALALALFVGVRQLPPARLAHRQGVDRDPRGRGRRRLDGHPDRPREAPRVRDGRRVRRHRRHVRRLRSSAP